MAPNFVSSLSNCPTSIADSNSSLKNQQKPLLWNHHQFVRSHDCSSHKQFYFELAYLSFEHESSRCWNPYKRYSTTLLVAQQLSSQLHAALQISHNIPSSNQPRQYPKGDHECLFKPASNHYGLLQCVQPDYYMRNNGDF